MEKVSAPAAPAPSAAAGSLVTVPGVVVVTDSSTCLPGELVASLGILVLPISTHLPETGPEGVDEPDAEWELPEALEHAELSGANHPFVTEYLQAMESPGY